MKPGQTDLSLISRSADRVFMDLEHDTQESPGAEISSVSVFKDLQSQKIKFGTGPSVPFEDLRQVATLLSGILVLAAAGSKSAVPDHPMLKAAEQLYQEAADGIGRSRPAASARRHHLHLLRASAAIGAALSAARKRMDDIDQVLTPLKAGYEELQRASSSLPGFEMVSFEHACCARPPQ